jgi:hypothetical protein
MFTVTGPAGTDNVVAGVDAATSCRPEARIVEGKLTLRIARMRLRTRVCPPPLQLVLITATGIEPLHAMRRGFCAGVIALGGWRRPMPRVVAARRDVTRLELTSISLLKSLWKFCFVLQNYN